MAVHPKGYLRIEHTYPPRVCSGCGSTGHGEGWRAVEDRERFLGDCCTPVDPPETKRGVPDAAPPVRRTARRR